MAALAALVRPDRSRAVQQLGPGGTEDDRDAGAGSASRCLSNRASFRWPPPEASLRCGPSRNEHGQSPSVNAYRSGSSQSDEASPCPRSTAATCRRTNVAAKAMKSPTRSPNEQRGDSHAHLLGEIDPEVRFFIELEPELLYQFDAQSKDHGYPGHRVCAVQVLNLTGFTLASASARSGARGCRAPA